jgi:Tol biopolymer transport system component
VIQLGDDQVVFSDNGAAVFSPDGKYLAVEYGGLLTLVSSIDWQRYTDFSGAKGYTFSPKGTYIAFTFSDYV